MKRLMTVCAVAVLCSFCFVRAEVEEGFTSLFNGKDLGGWVYGKRGNGQNKDGVGYQVENGAIYSTVKDGGNLYTEKEYGDFVLRFEFKLTEGANNGIGIRAPPTRASCGRRSITDQSMT